MKNRTPNYSFFAWILLLTIVTSSCVELVDTDPKHLIGRWQMVKVIDQGKTILRPDLSDEYNEVEIEFLKSGKIEGTLPMDIFTGTYENPVEDSITIACWPYTKKGEPDWGYYFIKGIRMVKTFSLRKNAINFRYQELHLNYDDGILIFNRVK